jgi:antirestriction protein
MTATIIINRPAGVVDYLPEIGAYFACLAAYNNGRLHGAWVDLEEITSTDDLQECIDYILASSPEPGAEEWAMHDHAGLPDCLSRTEWPDLADLASYGEALAGIGDDPDDREAFRLYCNDRGEIVDVDTFRDAYNGRHDSGSGFACDLADDLGLIPEGITWPVSCIDWEAAWRELEIGCDYTSEPASAGGLHIFRSC